MCPVRGYSAHLSNVTVFPKHVYPCHIDLPWIYSWIDGFLNHTKILKVKRMRELTGFTYAFGLSGFVDFFSTIRGNLALIKSIMLIQLSSPFIQTFI